MSVQNEIAESVSPRIIGPLPHVLRLLRVPLAVTLVLVLVLLDFVIPGSMREALRFALLDNPFQLAIIAVTLLLACTAVRFTGEAMIELVSPEMFHEPGMVRWVARGLPRLLALLIGLSIAMPMFQIAIDPNAIGEFDADLALRLGVQHLGGPVALAISLVYAAIGVICATVSQAPRKLDFVMRAPSLFARLGFSALMLALAGMFVVAVLGVWQPGVTYHAVEKYSTAIVGAFSDDTDRAHNLLRSWVYRVPADGQPAIFNQRYLAFVNPGPAITAQVSLGYVAAQLISVFLTCIAVRLVLAILLDLLFPWLGARGGRVLVARDWIPRLGSVLVGVALVAELAYNYIIAPPPDQYLAAAGNLPLSLAEEAVLVIIACTYLGIAVLASLFAGSNYVGDGLWRESPSVGRRFLGATRRIASLSTFEKWLIRLPILAGIGIFLFFVIVVHTDFQQVEIPQFIGPVGIVLLWGTAAAVLFFPMAYLTHMTRIPIITILVISAIAFAGFNLNENHELGTVDPAHAVPLPANGKTDSRLDFNLKNWIASRADWDQYDHYPVFLVATEGGGMRAAYFTTTVLAGLQDRCPAFSQHMLAISGVSGGSLGASVFAALAADHAKNTPAPGCDIDGGKKPGQIVLQARGAMKADLLSPLLGAALFPDALQRIIPVSMPSFDRARALEHAVEESWRLATPQGCTTCDPARLEETAMDLYGRPPAFNAVPNLFLNTTEAGTGRVVPYETMSVTRLSTRFRNQAEIDDGHLDCAPPVAAAAASLTPGNDVADDAVEQGYCVRKPPSVIETRYLQSDMQGGLDRIRLSTAALVSARFPYLTPAGSLSATGHRYVDGGYFENSGTWLIAGLLQNLIGQQFELQSAQRGKSDPRAGRKWVPTTQDEKIADAASKARFILIVIESEPCTRRMAGASCEEDATVTNDSYSEALSPLRALLSTRSARAEYSYDGLGGLTALIQQLRSRWLSGAPGDVPSNGTGMRSDVACDYPVCNVTLQFLNKSGSEIPLTWVLSNGARQHMDHAVDGMEAAAVRKGAPPESRTAPDDPKDIDRVLGSYRRVLCVLASRRDALAPLATPPVQQTSAAPVGAPPPNSGNPGPASVCTSTPPPTTPPAPPA